MYTVWAFYCIGYVSSATCPAGTYSSSTSSVSCDSCPAGSYSSSAGSTSCSPCPAGAYCSSSSLSPTVSAAPSSGLQLNYRFDAASLSGTSVKNSASGSYDAVLYNGATVSNNQLLLSSAKGQYMGINPFTTGSAGLTFATWWTSVNSGNYARIFDFGNGAGSDNILVHSAQAAINNNLAMIVWVSSVRYYLPTSVRFDQNSWNHVAWTLHPSGTWIVYINGVQVSSATSMVYPSSISRSYNYLGKSSFGDPYFNGTIKDFRMYSRVLSAVEVSSLFNATQTIFIGPTKCSNCSAGQYSSAGSTSCLTYPTAAPTGKRKN